MEKADIKSEDTVSTASKRITFKIGGQSSFTQAEQDSREFKHPQVFTNRSALFPAPQNFGLTIEVLESKPKAWVHSPSPLNQFYVQLTLEVTGPDLHRIEEWERRVTRIIKTFMPSSYGTTSERAEHLEKMGRHNVVTQGVASPQQGHNNMGGEREDHLRSLNTVKTQMEGAKKISEADNSDTDESASVSSPGVTIVED